MLKYRYIHYKNMTKIKDLPKVDQPREKLEKYGVERLSDCEIMAIIIRTGIAGTNVIQLSKQILKKVSVIGLEKLSIEDLLEIKGLGKTKAGQIMACLELGRRFLKDKKSELLISPEKVWEELKNIRDNKKEHFVVFYLDSRNQIIKQEIISIGTLNASLVHPREVFEPAIKNNAAQIIIAHNHPSGDCEPSREDLAITKRLQEAGKILGIEITDHMIVTNKSWGSFREMGLMGKIS